MVRTPRLTRETLTRFESAVALVLTVHAGLLWSNTDTGIWVWSIAGFLVLLGVLALVGVMRPGYQSVSLVRASLAVAIAVLVGEATGSLTGLFWVWFLALAFIYPMTLATLPSAVSVLVVAVAYGTTVHSGTSGFAVEAALLRSGVLGAIGLTGFALGLVVRRMLGERDDDEVRVREMQGVLDAAFDAASTGMVIMSLDGKIVDANQAMADFLGRSVESLVGTGWGSLIQPQERQAYTSQVAELIDGRIWSFQAETRFVLRDRRIRFGLVAMSLVADAAGRPRYLFAHVSNITDRVRGEERIRRSEGHFRNLFELAPVPLLQVDLTAASATLDVWRSQGVPDIEEHLEDPDQFASCAATVDFAALNEYARRMFKAEDAAGFNAAVGTGELGDDYCRVVRRVLKGMWDRETSVETAASLKDLEGGEHDGLVRVVIPEVDDRPEYARALLAFTDLTESLESRSELEQIEQQLRAVTNSAPIVLFAIDRHGVFTLSEGQGLELLGLEPGEAVGRSAFEMYREEPEVVEALRRALGGESFVAPVEVGDLVFETRYTPITDAGRVTGVIGVATDVTERTRANEQLEHLVRAKDQFMATVSHELRTPLTAVVGFAHQLRARLGDLTPEEISTFVDMIGEQATEVGDLVEDLLVISRSELGEVAVVSEPIELWRQVDAVVAARRIDATLTLEKEGSEAKVIGDAMRVRQIIRNLLTNADRYGGEHVTVRIVENPETTSLFVIDDGKGVPADEQADIFEPYYRAGTRVESVGLGLTVSRDLARLMGGDLTYVYYQGHSFFELRLPTT